MAALDQFIAALRVLQPKLAVILGSGQSAALSELREEAAISFADVPDLPAPTIAGHSGKIVAGNLGGRSILVFQGRVHRYEGHSWERVSAPVRFAARLGIKALLLTNAAGGIHPSLGPGSMMIVRDHLFWQKPGSWRGPGPAGCQCIAGDRSSPYSPQLTDCLHEAGAAVGENLMRGVYAAVTGPCYETPAEIRALQRCGADAVGMSTAFEAETAASLGLECAALSAITNRGAGLTDQKLNHAEVLQVMKTSCERLGRIIGALATRWI